jgi:hypothetical protein
LVVDCRRHFGAFPVCEFVEKSKIFGLAGIRIPTNRHLQSDFWPKPMLEHQYPLYLFSFV